MVLETRRCRCGGRLEFFAWSFFLNSLIFFRLFNDWASDNVYLQSKQTHKQSKSRRLFLTVFHFLTTFRTVKIPPLKNPPSPMHRSTKNSPFPAPSPHQPPKTKKIHPLPKIQTETAKTTKAVYSQALTIR
jgi:hypothetical protein